MYNKLLDFFKRYQVLLVVLFLMVLTIPSFWRMLRFGIQSLQDFHIFRLYEYSRCIQDMQIPCRWSPDASFEYGQPIFNFYGQASYLIGEVFRLIGFSYIDSLKGVFIFSLVASALTMFLLSKQVWKSNIAAIISSVVYVYAPYRALDVWVRGALPESVAFVLFPLIIYFLNDYFNSSKFKSLILFILSFSALVVTHNLSAFMFSIFLSIWFLYKLIDTKKYQLLPSFVFAGLLIIGLSSFYIIPVLFETKFITLDKTIEGYFNFRSHYTTLYQLFISNHWGYGASSWGNKDDISLSLGYVQWILSLVTLVLILVTKQLRRYINFFVLLFIGLILLWFTHNKSTFVWEAIDQLKYVQFPWRFIGIAVFSFSLAAGAVVTFFKSLRIKIVFCMVIIALAIAINIGYFFEDLWYKIGDAEQFSGYRYQQLVAASLNDYWPNYGTSVPGALAPRDPYYQEGSGSAKLIEKKSNRAKYAIYSNSTDSVIIIPIVYFPGWSAKIDNRPRAVYPSGDLGLITINIGNEIGVVDLYFGNTDYRSIGNIVSIFSLGILLIAYLKYGKR